MNSIVYVGMDVHKESYTLCCYSFGEDKLQCQQKIASDYMQVLKYLEQVRNLNILLIRLIDLIKE